MAHNCHIHNCTYIHLHRSSYFSKLLILLSHTSCYYQQKLCYYHTTHAIINKNHAIIKHLVLLSIKHMLLLYNLCYYQTPQQRMWLSNTSYYYQKHHAIKQIMLLSNTSCYYQHLNLLSLHFISYNYSLAQPLLIMAQLALAHVQVRKKIVGLFWGFQRRWSWIW